MMKLNIKNILLGLLILNFNLACNNSNPENNELISTDENKQIDDSNRITSAQPNLSKDSIKENVESYIPENNFDSLVSKFIKKEKDHSKIKKWISGIIMRTEDGDLSYVTKNCQSYINDVIDCAWGYPGSISEKALKKKWSNQFDLSHSDFGHLFEDGNGGWESKKLTGFEYLGELNQGDWYKLTIKGGFEENDNFTTLVRVIKVISKNNSYYIDNFISLNEE